MTVSQTDYIQQDAATRVQVLSEALPYIQQFIGRTIVVKYGGAAMKDSNLKDKVIRDIVFLSCVGLRPILVHGGGPEINSWLDKLGIEAQFKNGLRVTDAPTMDVVEMVLVGRVNKEIVSLINQAGGSAVGLCGKDGNLIKARPQGDEGIGFVGEVNSVNIKILETLVSNGYIPVVSSVAADETGQPYNINADTVAGEIAAAMGAEKLILLTDTRGILKDYKDPSTLIPVVDIQEARELISTGIVSGGMIPKVNCCVRSLAQGVKAAHIIDGRNPHSLLLEIFTNVGIGTMIVGSHLQTAISNEETQHDLLK
jgi:acetylglutamate kinase